MTTQIKITELGSIDNANLTSTTLFPGVNMVGTPLTQKVTLQQIGNVILTNAGGPNFPPANIANIAYSVVNAAQPNITSVGTLTGLTVSGNITIGGGNVATKVNTGYNVVRNTQATVDNIIARISSDGKAQISSVTSSSVLSYSGYEIVLGVHAAFSNTGTSVSAGNWLDITSTSLVSTGDIITATLQNISTSNVYRITYIQTENIANATIIIEKLM
jgi:hypothetical protein